MKSNLLAYFEQEIEPLNENLRRHLGITKIVVRYEPTSMPVRVLTSGEVYARSAAHDAHLDEIGV